MCLTWNVFLCWNNFLVEVEHSFIEQIIFYIKLNVYVKVELNGKRWYNHCRNFLTLEGINYSTLHKIRLLIFEVIPSIVPCWFRQEMEALDSKFIIIEISRLSLLELLKGIGLHTCIHRGWVCMRVCAMVLSFMKKNYVWEGVAGYEHIKRLA